MSLFPGYASTSKEVKKEDSEDEEKGRYTSFKIAQAAREKAMKKERDRMLKKIEDKKDRAAVRCFNLGDSDDDDDGPTMIVERSESEDENTRRIYHAQSEHRRSQDELEVRKRKNKEKRDNIYAPKDKRVKKECPSSDSDSSSRKSKKAKKDKDRDRYISPDKKPKPELKSKNNWHFMATVGVTKQNVNSYMMDDKRPDPLIKAMDRTESRQCANYNQRFTAVLGAPYKINKLFFPTKTVSRGGRILDKPIVLGKNPEFKFVKYPFVPGDAVALSTVRCHEQIELSEEQTQAILNERRERAAHSEKLAMDSDPTFREQNRMKNIAECKKRSMELNSDLSKNPKDAEKWIEFYRCEEEMNRLKCAARDATFNLVAANERKVAILDKALTQLPKNATLIIEKMKLKKQMNVSLDELNTEWKTIMNRLPNSLALWQYRLDEIKHDGKQFKRSTYIKVLEQATSDLKGLLDGTMKSHTVEPESATFLLKLNVLRVQMELAMGFVERAVSTAQVLIESNVFAPPRNIRHLFPDFKQIWENNLPLIGEPEGKGWFTYLLERQREFHSSAEYMVEVKEASEKYTNDELVKLGRSAQTEDKMVIFAQHERLHEKYHWRPIRAEVGDSQEEVERLVEFADLPIELFPCPFHFSMAVLLIKELGGLFYKKTIPSSIGWDDPTGVTLYSFGLLNPSLHSVPVGYPQFIDRLLCQMAYDNPDSMEWQACIPMTLARIRTAAWFIAQRDEPFDMSAVMKELNDIAVEVQTNWAHRTGGDADMGKAGLIMLITTFEALNLFQIQSDGMNAKVLDKAVKMLAKNIISKALAFSDGKPLDKISSDHKRSIVLVMAVLLVRLPGSWEVRKHRMQCVIMGKNAKTENLTLAEQMEAMSIVQRIRKKEVISPDPNNIPHIWITGMFGLDFLLASVCVCLFSLATAARTANYAQAKEDVKNIFGEVLVRVQLDRIPPAIRSYCFDHSEKYYEYYIHVLKHGKNEFRALWYNGLKNFLQSPRSVFLYREYISSQQKVVNEVGMLAEMKNKAETDESLFNSLARLYAHRKQFTRIVSSAEMQSDLAIAQRVIKVYSDEARRHRDPLLWRYALNLASELKIRKLGEEVFTQAFADCSWSRALHLDYIEAFPEADGQQLIPMSEKEIRIRGDPDHMQTYIDHARNADARRQ